MDAEIAVAHHGNDAAHEVLSNMNYGIVTPFVLIQLGIFGIMISLVIVVLLVAILIRFWSYGSRGKLNVPPDSSVLTDCRHSNIVISGQPNAVPF